MAVNRTVNEDTAHCSVRVMYGVFLILFCKHCHHQHTLMARFGNLNPYDLHKHLINDYILKKPGDTKLLQRDTSKDRTDYDVIRDNHQFLWDDDDAETDSWEKQLAKRYYDKLFKEYCICDLSRYKDNKVRLLLAVLYFRSAN